MQQREKQFTDMLLREKKKRAGKRMHMSVEQWKQYSSKIGRGGRSHPGTRSVMTENEIQTQIRMRLQYSGWYVIRHQQGMGSLKGLSDLSAIKDGRTVYIEVKKPGGVQSQYQKNFQEEIEAHGGQYILAKSVDDIKELIEV